MKWADRVSRKPCSGLDSPASKMVSFRFSPVWMRAGALKHDAADWKARFSRFDWGVRKALRDWAGLNLFSFRFSDLV